MDYSINLNGDVLKTALKFIAPAISREATRYYLNGVYFDKRPGEKLLLVATDGHRLHKIALECKGLDLTAEFSFLMPSNIIETLIKIIDKRTDYTLTFGDTFSIGYMHDGVAHGLLTASPIDGKFPNYQRVVPKTDCRAEMDSFNARYLVDAGKAFSLLGKSVGISAFQNAKGEPTVFKITVGSDLDAIIVLMPMRD